MYVPIDDNTLKPFDRVLFCDLPYGASSLPSNSHLSHASISFNLASALGLRRLSEENFAQDDFGIETITMGEDLTVRIKNVLKDYDIDYASNEWVANAADAKAAHVKIIVDEALFKGHRVVGPSFTKFLDCPALMVYNDGVFSEADFKGICKVGLGGKVGSEDSIGKFGLGALCVWHFGEVSCPSIHCNPPILNQYLPVRYASFRRFSPLFGPVAKVSSKVNQSTSAERNKNEH